jgi:hypothetical protein
MIRRKLYRWSMRFHHCRAKEADPVAAQTVFWAIEDTMPRRSGKVYALDASRLS